MGNVTNEEECDCPLECDALNYSYYYVSSPFDPEEMCPGSATTEDFLMREFYENSMPSRLVRKMEKFAYNTTDNMADLCRINVKYKAEVIFRIATNTMAVTLTSRRLSFFDKLSGFGKQPQIVIWGLFPLNTEFFILGILTSVQTNISFGLYRILNIEYYLP